MRIVIDRNIPYGESVFGTLGEVRALATEEVRPEAVRDADVLVIRSETKVNAALLEASAVRFVGTATIGTDHVDLEYLSARGIGFASAPGCNANSVSEYVTAALLTLAGRMGFRMKGKRLGIVGVGNIGSKVVKVGEALGMTVLQNDPPLARQTGDARFLPLDELMDADILTLHVPLSRIGVDATYHCFDAARIGAMKEGAILINASRGAVVETQAVKDALVRKHLAAAVLDVWEKEPAIDATLLPHVAIGTAHVAGYSLDGKVNAVKMVYYALCAHLGVQPIWAGWDKLPAPGVPRISLPTVPGGSVQAVPPDSPPAVGGGSPAPQAGRVILQSGSVGGERSDELLRAVIAACYDIELDDRFLRGMLRQPESARPAYFMKLRTGYRTRREFFATTVEVPPGLGQVGETLRALGFRVVPPFPEGAA